MYNGLSATSITELQDAVHEGMAYSFSAVSTMQVGATLVLHGKVGFKQVHFDVFDFAVSQGPVTISFYEAPTINVLGSLVQQVNRNRASKHIPTFKLYTGTTLTSNGTLLDYTSMVSVSQGNNKVSGIASVNNSWVLKQNTDYAIIISNQSGAIINYSANFFWHEANYELKD